MSIKITIGTHVIDFPTSGTDANWAEAVTDFAVFASETINGISSPYDIIAQVTELNQASETVPLTGSFDPASVRAFSLNYSISRTATNSADNITETGTVTGTYTASGWILYDEYTGNRSSTGSSFHSFSMPSNVIFLQTFPLDLSVGSTYSSGSVSYSAKVLPVTV